MVIDLKVFFEEDGRTIDKDFGRGGWDIPLTNGYEHESFEASSDLGKGR